MPRYKPYSYDQSVMLPIHFHEQILPGSIEEAIYCIVDKHLDMRLFDERYKNEDGGAPAYDPRVLLKILLLAYSRGITGSRDIEHLCRENIVFIAISAETKPDHSTIAGFVNRMDKEVEQLFRDVLLICYEMGLLGGKLYAIDGCKLPSNASKEWSGSKADFEKKKQKIELTIKYLIAQHKEQDTHYAETQEKHEERIRNLEQKVQKIKKWMDENDDKPGKRGRVKKSNITDNESGKMPSSHGVIQGYNGLASVDEKHQIIVEAQAYGEGQENLVFPDLLEKMEQTLQDVEKQTAPLHERIVIADSGFHSKENVHITEQKKIDAYIADVGFRKRDPRFKTADRHKQPIDRAQTRKTHKYFKAHEFHYDEQQKKLLCPAGNPLYFRNRNYEYDGRKAVAYMARIRDCTVCTLRHKCIRKKTTKARQVHIFYDHTTELIAGTERMKQKIDSPLGRALYSTQMKIVEPVFANIRAVLGLDRFSLLSRKKVSMQWQLFGIIHNIGKIARYGHGFT